MIVYRVLHDSIQSITKKTYANKGLFVIIICLWFDPVYQHMDEGVVLCFTSSVLLPPLWGNLILAQQVGSDLGSFSAISFSSHEWGGGGGGLFGAGATRTNRR